jgi:hypothetical protein
MKFADRVRSWALRLGIVIDEPAVIIIDDVVVGAMNDGAELVVGFDTAPRLEWPGARSFPQHQPPGEQ